MLLLTVQSVPFWEIKRHWMLMDYMVLYGNSALFNNPDSVSGKKKITLAAVRHCFLLLPLDSSAQCGPDNECAHCSNLIIFFPLSVKGSLDNMIMGMVTSYIFEFQDNLELFLAKSWPVSFEIYMLHNHKTLIKFYIASLKKNNLLIKFPSDEFLMGKF